MLGRLTSLLRRNANGIGIELAPERINIVQLRKYKQQYKLVANCYAELTKGIFEEGKIADGSVLA